jgi:hypothetical protein
MNDVLKQHMKVAWRSWYEGIAEDEVPLVNPSFEYCFEAVVSVFRQLLEMALPHVKASAEAGHFLDGFKRKRNELDDQVEMIKKVLK